VSNRRKLRPHEVAKRDQVFAEAMARLHRGEGVTWSEPADPGTQCSWCDCEWDWRDPDDRHARPGYVCPYPCPADAVYIEIRLSDPHPKPLPLCERHHGDWLDVMADVARVSHSRVDVIGPWMDDG
jgi:hypothetical protein